MQGILKDPANALVRFARLLLESGAFLARRLAGWVSRDFRRRRRLRLLTR